MRPGASELLVLKAGASESTKQSPRTAPAARFLLQTAWLCLGFCSDPSEPPVTDRVCLPCVLIGAREAGRLHPQQVFPDHPREALRGPKAGAQALPPGGAAKRDLLVPSELGYETCKQSQTLGNTLLGGPTGLVFWCVFLFCFVVLF